MKKEKVTIKYGSESIYESASITINKGEQSLILSKEDLAFIVESAIRSGEVSIKVTPN